MGRKSTQKVESTTEYDSQRQQNVLLEKIYSEVKTIGEGHTGLNRKLDKLDDRVYAVESSMGRMEIKLVEHDRHFELLETAITENSKDIKSLKTDVGELKTDLKRIDRKIDTVTTDHERRIQKIEAVG